jgi:hyperosmotically inducible protein
LKFWASTRNCANIRLSDELTVHQYQKMEEAMHLSERKHNRNAAWQVAACMLALNLAACGDKPPEPAKPAPAMKPAPVVPEKKAEPPKEAAPAPKTAEDSKAAANAALAAKVKAALAAEHGLEALVIDVDAKDGVVSLFGTADNNANRDKAGRVASKVAGVKSVVNKLVIASGS